MSVRTPVRPSRAGRARRDLPGWSATSTRLILAGVFLAAGVAKVGDPAASVRAVRAYQLLPDTLTTAVGRGLPALEIALAIVLLLGLAVRAAATIAAVLLAAFTVGIGSVAARGLRIDCGCFGGGGPTTHPHYTGEIVRDVAPLAGALWLVRLGRSRLAAGPTPPEAPDYHGLDHRRAQALGRRHDDAAAAYGRVHRLLAGGVIGTVLLAALGGVVIAAATASAPPTAVPVGVTAAGGIVVGSPDAPHTVIAYEDPQCPVCGQFEKTSGPTLAAAVKAGQVKVEYRMRSFLGPESVRAVAALGAAQDEGRFEALREELYAHQPAERTGGFTIRELLSLGADVGLTDTQFIDAVSNQTYAAWARSVDDRASRDGNTGTPQLLLDAKALGSDVTFDPAALAAALRR